MIFPNHLLSSVVFCQFDAPETFNTSGERYSAGNNGALYNSLPTYEWFSFYSETSGDAAVGRLMLLSPKL